MWDVTQQSLGELIEELRRIERRRTDATPRSSEYMELLGFERRLVDRIREQVAELDGSEPNEQLGRRP
jgi:uncharacterized membrane protein